MAQTLDGLILPNYADDGFKPLTQPNYAKNYPLAGNLYVDFYNMRSGWKITFDVLTYEEYQAIRAKYEKQFTDETFLEFTDDELAIQADCFLNVPDEHNVKWNKSVVKDFTITLEPESADSL